LASTMEYMITPTVEITSIAPCRHRRHWDGDGGGAQQVTAALVSSTGRKLQDLCPS
jgi:hypothetical protein